MTVLLDDVMAAASTQEVCHHLSYLPGFENLLRRSRSYTEVWVCVFYATMWIEPDHEYIQLFFQGPLFMILSYIIQQTFGFREVTTRVHSLCYDLLDPP